MSSGYLLPGDFEDRKPPEFPTVSASFVHEWSAQVQNWLADVRHEHEQAEVKRIVAEFWRGKA